MVDGVWMMKHPHTIMPLLIRWQLDWHLLRIHLGKKHVLPSDGILILLVIQLYKLVFSHRSDTTCMYFLRSFLNVPCNYNNIVIQCSDSFKYTINGYLQGDPWLFSTVFEVWLYNICVTYVTICCLRI